MFSFEFEEDGIHDSGHAMDIDSDDLDDAQGDIDIDADGVVDYEQDVPQRYSSPFEAQVASTSRRTVSADLTSLTTFLYMATLLDPPLGRRFRSSFYAPRLKHTLIFTRDTRTTFTRPKRRTTKTTPPTPTRNMAPRRKPPRRGTTTQTQRYCPPLHPPGVHDSRASKSSRPASISSSHRVGLGLGLWVSIQEEEESSCG